MITPLRYAVYLAPPPEIVQLYDSGQCWVMFLQTIQNFMQSQNVHVCWSVV